MSFITCSPFYRLPDNSTLLIDSRKWNEQKLKKRRKKIAHTNNTFVFHLPLLYCVGISACLWLRVPAIPRVYRLLCIELDTYTHITYAVFAWGWRLCVEYEKWTTLPSIWRKNQKWTVAIVRFSRDSMEPLSGNSLFAAFSIIGFPWTTFSLANELVDNTTIGHCFCLFLLWAV